MELNLRSFKKVWVQASLFCLLQLALIVMFTVGISYYTGWTMTKAMVLGFVTALSSTAVVVKMLESSGEIKTENGQLIIGILIAQDLAIAPMILVIRNTIEVGNPWGLFIKLFASIIIIVAIIMYLSRKQRVRIPFSKAIVGESELTALASLAFCFIASAISGLSGLSAPYGAFLAGLILGNTHERLNLLETAKPIQSILIMFFFLSIGLLLDVEFLYNDLQFVLLTILVIFVGKTIANVLVLRLLSVDWLSAFSVGACISQLGEFSFLLSNEANSAGVITDNTEKYIVSITVLSLIISPIWNALAQTIKNVFDMPQFPPFSVLKENKENNVSQNGQLGSHDVNNPTDNKASKSLTSQKTEVE
jgi:CPA2 family monovalent cation:H+ antiporter-2